MRLRHMITGVRRAVVREALPEKYQWSCTKGERTPYAADVRARLEGAYFEAATGPWRVVPDGRRGKRQHRAPQNIAADLGDGRDGASSALLMMRPAVPLVLVM